MPRWTQRAPTLATWTCGKPDEGCGVGPCGQFWQANVVVGWDVWTRRDLPSREAAMAWAEEELVRRKAEADDERELEAGVVLDAGEAW